MFYVVHSDLSGYYAQAEYSKQKMKQYECKKCHLIYKSVRADNYHVHFIDGRLPDFYNAPGCYIGNCTFFNMLDKYELTGYEIREIVCTGWQDKKGNPMVEKTNDLREVFILGRCGVMCHVDGKEVERCDVCGRINFETRMNLRGLSVDVETWDGSDIFSFSNWPGVMIATQRFKDACETERIKGITFEALDKFCFMP